MKLLTRFFAALLALSLVITAAAWTISVTFLNSGYLQHSAQRARFAQQLSVALPPLLTPKDADPAAAGAVKRAITPQLINDQVNSVIPQMVRHLVAAGPPATLDLRDLDVTLRAGGIQSPKQSETLSTPIVLNLGTLDAPAINAAHLILTLRWATPLAALLILFLAAAAARARRWRLLGKTFVFAAIFTVILVGLVYLPALIVPMVFSGSSTKPIQEAVRSLAGQIAAGQALYLLYFAAGYAAFGLLMFLIHPFAKLGAKRRRSSRSEDSDYQPLLPYRDV
jgi:hypothetical protein